MNVRRPIRAWRACGKPQRIEIYNRWSMYALTVVVPVLSLPYLVLAGRREAPAGPTAVLCVAALAQALCSVPLIRAGMASHVGRRPLPTGWLLVHGATTALGLWLALLLGPHHDGKPPTTVIAAEFMLILWIVPPALTLRPRFTALYGVGMLALSLPPLTVASDSLPAAVGVLIGGVLGMTGSAASSRCSAWMVGTTYELDAARETQSRLAVAEERLRFSRDLHDVLGRNLTTMALKSELAVQLARRGRPEAADQMVEVQRIAQESQREVREVVRGYRTADLHGEVIGARSVLRAAGISCTVDLGPDPAALAPLAQSVLGWVVREAATNVLRHSEAHEVAVRLHSGPRQAVLELENDGVTEPVPRTGEGARPDTGSGLAGLRERLGAHGGELTVERPAPGRFLLRATLPLPRTPTEPAPDKELAA
ncbi:histidine kinase [Kitasatospora nipponensis]|uniref:Histidine kinase n=1 Tax=Kitasatospora nipponensis TaxID=258049 RepID=A0ABN1WCF6_9ACTN